MDKRYSCYCGLYCENCPVNARVEPAARTLFDEMRQLGFEEIIHFFPDGRPFWNFLQTMAEQGICVSCRDGSGNPGCEIRICAKEKNVDMCAFCGEYPCARFEPLFDCETGYATLRADNEVLRTQGMDAWGELQDKRLPGAAKTHK